MKGDFKELKVWQKSMDLAKDIYCIVRSLPIEERYALADQMRRAAVSIPSNIAEGYGKNSDKEFIRFLFIARGSLSELETQLYLCIRLYDYQESQLAVFFDKIEGISKMLIGLISYLNKRCTTRSYTVSEPDCIYDLPDLINNLDE